MLPASFLSILGESLAKSSVLVGVTEGEFVRELLVDISVLLGDTHP